jgi:hypothetical protein
MPELIINIDKKKAQILHKRAKKYNLTLEQLISAEIDNLALQPADSFENIITSVLDKNFRLYNKFLK